MIGTTDVRFEGNPDEVRCEQWEIDYLLAETNLALPNAGLTRDSILYTYSGVRPLPVTGDKDEQSITRRHFIREHPGFRICSRSLAGNSRRIAVSRKNVWT